MKLAEPAAAVEQFDCPTCEVPAGSACRTRGDPYSPTVATEFLTTSISSGGDESVPASYGQAVLAENAHIRYYSGRRGYVRCRVTPRELRADYRTMPYVTHPDAPISTDTSFLVLPDEPGLRPA